MKLIFLLILYIVLNLISFPSFVYAQGIKLNEYDKNNINTSKNKNKIITRLSQYIKIKKKVKDFTLIRKLSHINTFYNKILPVNDLEKYNADDYWATPKEFLIQGKGDCEDYALAKYFTLLELGIKKENLFLSVVKVKNEANYHMVLLFFKNINSMPLVLDNLSSKIVTFNKRKKLIPKFIFNEKEAFLLKNKFINKKVRINWGKEDKWKNILKRVYIYNQ